MSSSVWLWLWRRLFAVSVTILAYTGAVLAFGPTAGFQAPSYVVLRDWPLGGTRGLGVAALLIAANLLIGWARHSTDWIIRASSLAAGFWLVWTGCIIASFWANGSLPLPAYGQYLGTTLGWVLLALSVPPGEHRPRGG